MEWLINNWYIALGLIALLVAGGLMVYKFAGFPTKEQIVKIKALLLYWVILAEKELGNGTGQLKLRYVYDLFTAKFKVVARLVSFEIFSVWVDEALEQMREMLNNNVKVNEIVNGISNK